MAHDTPPGPQDGYPPPGQHDPYGGYGYPGQQGHQYQPPPVYPPYGWGGYQVEHPQGTLIMVLGILSLVVCQIIGPFAWVMGNNALREIDQNPYGYSNRGSVQAGRICGIVATCLMIAQVVIAVAIFIPLAVTAGA